MTRLGSRRGKGNAGLQSTHDGKTESFMILWRTCRGLFRSGLIGVLLIIVFMMLRMV